VDLVARYIADQKNTTACKRSQKNSRNSWIVTVCTGTMSKAVKTADDVQRRATPASRPVLMRLGVRQELDGGLRAIRLALEQR
jgi:hypothetical protein